MTLNMVHKAIRVLLIEDNAGDIRLIEEQLRQPSLHTFTLTCENTLAEGVRRLREDTYDVVLLDLKLPDSSGSATLEQVQAADPRVPVVVLSGAYGEEHAPRLAEMGAKDYVSKDDLSPKLLLRAIRMSILARQLDMARHERDWLEREVRVLEELTGSPTPVSARMYGLAGLKESSAGVFGELVGEYGRLLDIALENEAFRTEGDATALSQALADRLGRLGAGPRDVVDIHTAALAQRQAEGPLQRVAAYIEVGRLVVLELMGHLVSAYRARALGQRWVAAHAKRELVEDRAGKEDGS